ncbi:MAG: Ig-like domain-containing protein, partial [Pseudomonadota bacterium]
MRDHSLALLLTFFILPFAHAQAPDELSQSVAVAENSLWFERNVKVNSGHVIVNGVATGTTLFPGADMVLGRETDTPASYWVAADSVGIDIYSEIGSDVYVNTLTTHPNITLTGQQLPYTAPVLPTLPMFQSSTPGTEDIYLDGGSWNKWPGRYGDLTIVDGTLELRGGNYTFQDITIESSGNLKFTGPAVVRVKGRLWMGNWSELNDPTGAGVTIYVEGQNGTDGALTSTPAAVELGNGADVEATIFAPNGTISSDGNVDGALIARDVYIDSHSSLTLASTFSAADVVPIADGRDLLARQDALLTFDLEASGPTGTQLTFQVATSPANGTLNFVQTLDNYTASFTYQPDPGYVGSDSFAFEVVAGGATSLPAQVDIRVQPSVDMEFEKTVALATNSLEFKREVYVKSGHVIVNEPANGPSLIDGFDLFMGRGSDFPDSFAVKGDRVFAAFYGTYDADIESRTLTGQGQVYQSTHSGLRVRGAPWPVFATLPPFETGTPGTQVVDVDAANGSQVIVAGDFDTITVGDSASLEFGPGIYNLNSFTVGPQSRVKFDGQVTLRIADRMMVANNARLEPKAADGNPSEIIIYVAGSNGGAGGIADTPAALDSGNYSHIRANLYVPNGTIRSDATRFEGAMIARDIQLGQGATLTLDNGFIDGTGGVGPFADPQTISLDEDTSATVTLTGSGGQGALSFSVSVAPMYGQLSGTAPNLTYTPNADFNGTDNFVFVADDGTNQSSPAVVTLEVLPVADAPVAFDGSGTTDFDQPLDLTVSASDGDGDTLTYSVTTPPASGTLNGTGPNYTYTPNAGFSGTDSFVFEASDGTLISNAATFTITVVSTTQPPIASDGTVTLDEDSSAAFVLNASDPNNDPLTYTILTAPTQGLLTGTEPNLTYTPSANFNGTDTLTFSVNDGTADSNVATVTFTVNPVNDPPVANSDSIGLDEDTSANIVISASDIDGDTLSYQVITSPAQGTLSGIGPNYTYTPAANFNGADSFTVVANDGSVDSNLATVTLAVSPVNDEPVANGGAVSVNEDDAVPVTLTGSDVDGDALSFEVIRSPVNGSLTGTAPNLTYAPAPDFNGTDSFDFRAADGTTVSGNATFTITVNPVNDAPTALPQTLNAIAGEALNVTLAGQDIDSTTLSFTVTQGPTNGTLSGSGANQVYTANLGFSGSDQFSFVANDGALDSSPAVVTITVQPGNQAPTVDPIADAVVAAG